MFPGLSTFGKHRQETNYVSWFAYVWETWLRNTRKQCFLACTPPKNMACTLCFSVYLSRTGPVCPLLLPGQWKRTYLGPKLTIYWHSSVYVDLPPFPQHSDGDIPTRSNGQYAIPRHVNLESSQRCFGQSVPRTLAHRRPVPFVPRPRQQRIAKLDLNCSRHSGGNVRKRDRFDLDGKHNFICIDADWLCLARLWLCLKSMQVL